MAAKRPPGHPLHRPRLRDGQPASPGSAWHTAAALCVRRRPTAPDRLEPVPAAPGPSEGRWARGGARRGLWGAAAEEGQGRQWGTPYRSLGVTHAGARTPLGDTRPQPGTHTHTREHVSPPPPPPRDHRLQEHTLEPGHPWAVRGCWENTVSRPKRRKKTP